ncbi:hypothetical protein [Chitinophaga sp. MM2321]|uniref:hypothetical protein n=1 Tax=Chitinophaga sp. MM2321 TaxID=3137178 RepID=UPI0032D5A84F
MRVQIRKRFRDADTMQLMLPGRHAEYEIGRAHKLARSGFVLLLDPVEESLADEQQSNESIEPVIPGTEEKPEKIEGVTKEEKVETPSPKKSEVIAKKRGPKPKK